MKKLAIIGAFLLLALPFTMARADSLPDGCRAGDNYSATTGHPCALPDCAPGDLFSAVDGHRCGGVTYLPGCFSTAGYSTVTGNKCDGSTVNTTPITTNPTNTVNTQPSDTTTTPTDTTPVLLTPAQIALSEFKAKEYALREQYPDMRYVATMSMTNGKPGMSIETSLTDHTVIAEIWVDENNNSTLHLISK